MTALKEELGSHFIEQPFNKWCIYLRDFILHLDQLMSNEPEQNERTQFVFENLEVLAEVESLKKNAFEAVKTRLCRCISEKMGEEVSAKSETWYQYPAFRFYQEDKHKNLEIVLYFEKGALSLNTYIYDPSIEKADKHLWHDGMDKKWFENKGTIRGYRERLHTRGFEDFDATLENIAEIAHQRTGDGRSLGQSPGGEDLEPGHDGAHALEKALAVVFAQRFQARIPGVDVELAVLEPQAQTEIPGDQAVAAEPPVHLGAFQENARPLAH